MRAGLLAVAIAAGFATLLSDCAPAPREPATEVPAATAAEPHATEDSAAEPPTTELTDRDDGRTVQLKPGEEILIKLSSNRGMGYAWGLNDRQVGVLELVGEPGYTEIAGPGESAGAAGMESWRLRAVKAGDTTLRFEYQHASDEATFPERSLTYSIKVR